jgi:hypothetical protein
MHVCRYVDMYVCVYVYMCIYVNSCFKSYILKVVPPLWGSKTIELRQNTNLIAFKQLHISI